MLATIELSPMENYRSLPTLDTPGHLGTRARSAENLLADEEINVSELAQSPPPHEQYAWLPTPDNKFSVVTTTRLQVHSQPLITRLVLQPIDYRSIQTP